MGASLHPLLASLDIKGMVPENTSSGGPLWCKFLKAQAIRRRRRRRRRSRRMTKRSNEAGRRWSMRPARMTIKRRRVLQGGSTRPMNEMERKVRTLKKLIPNSSSSPLGLDGLFRQTADYIQSLQMQVKVMQVMVKVLAGSEE